MKINVRNILIILIVAIIVFLSFEMTDILFKIEDTRMSGLIYVKEKSKSKIDVQVENIYLVKAIQDMNKGYFDVEIGNSNKIKRDIVLSTNLTEQNNIIENLENEILKLEDYKIMKKSKETFNSFGIIEKKYQKNGTEYMMSRVLMQNEQYEINIEVEEKTGKILYIDLPKSQIINDIDKKEIMENYIRYLDLYIIDDWKMENNMLTSEKAQLTVSLLDNNKDSRYILSIHPISNNFIVEYSTISK